MGKKKFKTVKMLKNCLFFIMNSNLGDLDLGGDQIAQYIGTPHYILGLT